MIDKAKLFFRFAVDRRLRQDYRAMKYSADGYVHYGIKLLQEEGVWNLLESKHQIEEIQSAKDLSHSVMLQHILDYLVQRDILTYNKVGYSVKKHQDPFSPKKRKYLEQQYPYSVKWNDYLLERAPETLRTGKSPIDAGFESEFLDIWDAMMDEAPYSFKKYTVRKIRSDIRDGDSIIDLGCGSGSMLQIFLEEIPHSVKITGIDQSEKSLRKAEKRLNKLARSSTDPTLKSNVDVLEFQKHDLESSNRLKYQYDFGISSLVFNHISEEKHRSVLEKIHALLKPGGKFVMYQLIHTSRFDRIPIWLMHIVPTHEQYPFKEPFLNEINSTFDEVHTYMGDTIVVAEKSNTE